MSYKTISVSCGRLRWCKRHIHTGHCRCLRESELVGLEPRISRLFASGAAARISERVYSLQVVMSSEQTKWLLEIILSPRWIQKRQHFRSCLLSVARRKFVLRRFGLGDYRRVIGMHPAVVHYLPHADRQVVKFGFARERLHQRLGQQEDAVLQIFAVLRGCLYYHAELLAGSWMSHRHQPL